MICVIAMIVFGILSIFSASYRPVAKEAFDCVFRRITLRKCESGLDTRMKSKIVGKLMIKSPGFARQVYVHFEKISWFFVILFFVSLFFTGQAVYNIVLYDNCNGPVDENGFCIITGNGGDVVEKEVIDCEDPKCVNGVCEECGTECECGTCEE